MRSNGPQSERDRRFWDEKADIPSVLRSDLVMSDNEDKKVYEGEISRMRRENISLKDQLQRSLRELKVYQIKYPSAYAPAEEEDDLPPWTTNPEIMTPLLQAYDSRIKELEDIVGQQSVELELFREKVASVLAENEELRQGQLERLRQHADSNLGPMGPLNAELLAEMNERVEILMEENTLMVEQKSKLSSTLDELQEELGSRTLELSAVVQHLTSTDKELLSVKQKLAQAEKDREEAAGQTVGYSEELGSARGTVDSMREQISMWQLKFGDAELAIKDLRKQLTTTATQAEENNLLNMRRTRSAEDRVRDLHALLLQKTQDLDSSVEVGRKLRREYLSTRQDAEGMLQVMGGLERQVADYHEREEEVQRLARESRQKVEDALSLKEQACAREDHCQREVIRLQEERGMLLMRRQADVDAATEVTRQRAAAQKRSCEDDLKEISIRNADLIVATEKALKDAQSSKDLLDRLASIRENERRAVDGHLSELADKLNKTIIALEDEKSRRNEVQEINKDLRFTIDKLRSQSEIIRNQQIQSDKAKELELQAVKIPLRESQRQLTERTRELSKRCKELEELKNSNETYLASIERKYGEETALYRKRSADATLLKNEMDLIRTQGDQHAQLVVDEIKLRATSTQKLLEGRLREEAELARRLGVKYRESDSALKEVSEERSAYLSMLEDARSAIAHLQDELTDARCAVADLTSQLSSSYDARASTARLIEDMGRGAFDESKDRGRDYVDSIIGGSASDTGNRRGGRMDKERALRSLPEHSRLEELDQSF